MGGIGFRRRCEDKKRDRQENSVCHVPIVPDSRRLTNLRGSDDKLGMRLWSYVLGFAFCAAAFAVSCYKPDLSGAGLRCHEADEPACPDGQVCTGGRCTAPGGMVMIDGGFT